MVMVSQFYEYTKNYWIVHTLNSQFVVCELYINKIILKYCLYVLHSLKIFSEDISDIVLVIQKRIKYYTFLRDSYQLLDTTK